MNRFIKIFFCLVLMSAASCVQEMFPEKPQVNEGEGWLMFDFGAESPVQVITKATHDEVVESQIYNFYLLIFDGEGNKLYGQYFDADNQENSAAAVEAASNDCWYVSNTTTSGVQTTGRVKIKASAGSELKVYMLVNLDADMVKISSDLLSHTIKNEADLKNFNVYMNQTTVARNGYFPMNGSLSNVSISGGTMSSPDGTLMLKRLDAKVRFIFKQGERIDEKGQTITKFEAKQWKVVNVPRTAYLLDYAARGKSDDRGHDHGNVPASTDPVNYSTYAANFFDTEFVNFEKFPSTDQSEFSFYMLENRQIPKQTPAAYQDRSRQLKRTDSGFEGENTYCEVSYSVDGVPVTREMRVFENANDFSTYVLVTGHVEMDLVNDDAGQTLGGEVQYLIHLGDWSSVIDSSGPGDTNDTYGNIDDYNTLRNTDYTYTVTVNSVNNIRVEVESSRGSANDVIENQPGASGSVTVAKEEIALCDCHYVAKTLDFHLINFFEGGKIREDACIVDKMTWMASTPFGEGMPEKIGDIDITDGLDYEWVHFRLNKKDASGNYYSDQRRKYSARVFASSTVWNDESANQEDDGTDGMAGYHNDGCMDVVALVKYMQQQVELWLTNKDVCDFDNKDATDLTLPKISVTVFVDEYYYHEHPLTKDASDVYLWKKFVNQEDRKMHILCSSDSSKDLESKATGSVITIQQKSIKTMFNTDYGITALSTAWGLEVEDEHEHENWTYPNPRGSTYDDYNGLINSCYEWNLCSNTTSNSWTSGQRWSTYMNFEVNNDTPILNSSYRNLRYSCMSRNRDNNGNGIIERDEIRWYTASIKQLVGMFVGADVVPSNARLYNRSPEEQNNEDTWYQRVASSTNGTTVWAEEGIATGARSWSGGSTVRCIRNLGDLDGVMAGGGTPESYAITVEPQDYITLSEDSSEPGSYIFDATFINNGALRYYSSKELPFHNEREVENRLYKTFKTAPAVKAGASGRFMAFNENVNNAIAQNQEHPYCPEGYRVPNQREMAMMDNYTPDIVGDGYMTRTKWFFGQAGEVILPTAWTEGREKYGFCINSGDVSLQFDKTGTTTRCVKDIRVD